MPVLPEKDFVATKHSVGEADGGLFRVRLRCNVYVYVFGVALLFWFIDVKVWTEYVGFDVDSRLPGGDCYFTCRWYENVLNVRWRWR